MQLGYRCCFAWLCTAMLTGPVFSAVLPDDKAEALYHRYEGGGMVIDGPSVLVRKSLGLNTSVYTNYYVDMVSSASVDVLASASPYTEEREEVSLGADFLVEKSIISLSYTNSEENDFSANSVHFGISQDFFGDLTNLSLGISKGWDEVGKTGAPEFSEDVDRTQYRLGLNQILTKSFLMNFGLEIITDEGYLNNPYRLVRYLSDTAASGYEFQSEVYPNTRTSNAFAVRGLYYLPYRAAAKFDYRYFTDNWGIKSHTVELSYVHPVGDNWIFETRVRHYEQTAADFFSDLLPYRDAQNFMARDKELSDFSDLTVGLGIEYHFRIDQTDLLKSGSVMLQYDHIMFDYQSFRDITQTGFSAGSEPLYSFSADVTRLLFTLKF